MGQAANEAKSVPANFGMKDEFRPDLGGGGAAGMNSSASRSGGDPQRVFPGGQADKMAGQRTGSGSSQRGQP